MSEPIYFSELSDPYSFYGMAEVPRPKWWERVALAFVKGAWVTEARPADHGFMGPRRAFLIKEWRGTMYHVAEKPLPLGGAELVEELNRIRSDWKVGK